MIETDSLYSQAPRMISPAPQSRQEEVLERALRPKQLQEYVGQRKARQQLEIFIVELMGIAPMSKLVFPKYSTSIVCFE